MFPDRHVPRVPPPPCTLCALAIRASGMATACRPFPPRRGTWGAAPQQRARVRGWRDGSSGAPELGSRAENQQQRPVARARSAREHKRPGQAEGLWHSCGKRSVLRKHSTCTPILSISGTLFVQFSDCLVCRRRSVCFCCCIHRARPRKDSKKRRKTKDDHSFLLARSPYFTQISGPIL